MSKILKPYDILNGHRFYGVSCREVIHMLEHYGFERVHADSNTSKHIVFRHRDYWREIDNRNVPHGGGELDAQSVRDSANACMEVERLNALREEPVFDKIPEWALKSLPQGTLITKGDNRVEFENGAVLDLEADDMPPVRHYMLEMRGNKLAIRSMDYSDEAFSASCTVQRGSANTAALKNMFDGLDASVCEHANDVYAKFQDDLRRLQENHGYELHTHELPFTPNRLSLSHPIYSTQFRVVAPIKGQAISDETVDELHALLEQSREYNFTQMETLEALRARGWNVEKHPANGAARHLNFAHSAGASFDMPIYGNNEVFDDASVKAQVDAIEHPVIETDGGMPAVGSAQVQRPFTVEHVVKRRPGTAKGQGS